MDSNLSKLMIVAVVSGAALEGGGVGELVATLDPRFKLQRTEKGLELINFYLPRNERELAALIAALGDEKAKLTALELFNTDIEDFSLLGELTGLKELKLRLDDDELRMINLDFLRNLVNLESLYISGLRFRDIQPVEALVNLRKLVLSTSTTDLKPLSNLPRLVELNLSYCSQLSDLGPLSKMVQLVVLLLEENSKITDVTPLKNLVNLSHLDLTSTGVTDVRILHNLPDTARVFLAQTHLAVIPPRWKNDYVHITFRSITGTTVGHFVMDEITEAHSVMESYEVGTRFLATKPNGEKVVLKDTRLLTDPEEKQAQRRTNSRSLASLGFLNGSSITMTVIFAANPAAAAD